MKDLVPYIVSFGTLLLGFLFGRRKNDAEAKESESVAEKNVATLYKEAADYWKGLFEQTRAEKEALIEKQLNDRKAKEVLERKIDELEKKIDMLSSQVKQFEIKYDKK